MTNGSKRDQAGATWYYTLTDQAPAPRPTPAPDPAELERASFWARAIMLAVWIALLLPVLGISAGVALRLFLWISQI